MFACLIYDQVAIIEGLNAEEVEVHVGRGVDGIGQRVDVVAEHLGRQALNRYARAKVALEGLAMSLAEPLDAVAHDFPIQHLFVYIGEHDAGGEFCKIRIAFDECAGIEDDRALEDVLIDFGGERTAEFAFDLKLVEVQIEADHGKLNAALELGTIPENGLAIALSDDDERVLGFLDLGIRSGIGCCILAVATALGAVKNVAFGDLVEPLAHQFLLNHVLHILDVNEGAVTKAYALRHSASDRDGAFRIFLHRQESLAACFLDLGWHPGDHVPISANEADVDRGCFWIGVLIRRRADGALKNKTLGHIVGIVVDESFFDQKGKIVLGETQSTRLAGLLNKTRGD